MLAGLGVPQVIELALDAVVAPIAAKDGDINKWALQVAK